MGSKDQRSRGYTGCFAVIPARYQSSRFPGKALADILGKPMIQRVYEQVSATSSVEDVCVATDDERIVNAVQAFGGQAVMTDPNHPSGSDRVAEVLKAREPELVLNVQGDEPLVTPKVLEKLINELQNADTTPEMATLAVPVSRDEEKMGDPNNVKVVVDPRGNALYFSRALIPYKRDDAEDVGCLWHWGIYAYRGWYLKRFVSLDKGKLENSEKLEQLRALEDGARIRVVNVDEEALDVNVPADIPLVEDVMSKRGNVDG